MRLTAKAKRAMQQSGRKFGCHVDLSSMDDDSMPDGCVLDYGDPDACIYGSKHRTREGCKYWREVTEQSIRDARNGL